jgi:hypothetical protein
MKFQQYFFQFVLPIVLLLLLSSCVLIHDTEALSVSDGYGEVHINIPQIRGWSVQTYYVTATRQGFNPVQVTTAESSVTMTLQIGSWEILVEGFDTYNNLIYQGIANAMVQQSGTSVTIGLLKRAGNLKVTPHQSVNYNVSEGWPGYIEKFVISADKVGFTTIIKETNNVQSSLFFSGLVQGGWLLTIEGQYASLDPETYNPSGGYTTCLSGFMTANVSASSITDVTGDIDKQVKVSPVLFSHESGTYPQAIDLELDCDTLHALILYSLDGSTPGTVYSEPISIISGTVAVTVLASAAGVVENSIIASRTYTIDSEATTQPVFIPGGGTFTSDISVTINSPDGGTIYYTMDGSTPDINSTVYSGSIPLSGNNTVTVLNAVAKVSDKSISSVAEATYTINYPKVVAPQILPLSGTYTEDQLISIECGTTGASIYYTLDGSEPGSESFLYNTPFTLPEGEYTVRAIGKATDLADSEVVSALYTISNSVNNSIILTEAEVIIPGQDWTESAIDDGINWFGFEIATSGYFVIELDPAFQGTTVILDRAGEECPYIL